MGRQSRRGPALARRRASLRPRQHPGSSVYSCTAYYFLGRYGEAVEACDRALARNPGRSTQTDDTSGPGGELCRVGQSRRTPRASAPVAAPVAVFRAERFAAQFGTQETRDHMLEGLKESRLSLMELRQSDPEPVIRLSEPYCPGLDQRIRVFASIAPRRGVHRSAVRVPQAHGLEPGQVDKSAAASLSRAERARPRCPANQRSQLT